LRRFLVKLGKIQDITGGLPRVTELFEARNPSNPAVVSEIDGVVSFGKIKRGNREVIVTSKDGQRRKYLIGLSKHILVQDGDFVRAGTPLSDGATAPRDILNIKGTICGTAVPGERCTGSISLAGYYD
jgi:DNA-directed RNA polymerase subunit beta'